MKHRWSSIITLLTLAVCSASFAQGDMMSAVPAWSKVVVKFDLREDSESMKAMRKYMKPQQIEPLEQLLLGLGQAALMHSGAGHLDIVDDVIACFGRRGVIAVDPGLDKKPQMFLALLEVRDPAKMKALLDKGMPQLAALSQGALKSTTVGAATIWTLTMGKDSAVMALGPTAIAFTDNVQTARSWLNGAGSGAGKTIEAALAKVRPGVVNFYVDQAVLTSKELLSRAQGAEEVIKALQLKTVVGSLTIQEDGLRYEAATLVGDNSPLKKLAAGIPAGAPRGFTAVPDEAMLALTTTSISALLSALPLPIDPASLLQLVGGQLAADVPAAAINAFLGADLAIALTKIDMPPGVSVSLVGKDAEGTAQAFTALKGLVGKTGVVKLSEEQLDGKSIVKVGGLPAEARIEALYAAVAGNRIVLASDKATLGGAISSIKNLASHPRYQKVQAGLPTRLLMTLYADPSAILQKAGGFGTARAGVKNKYLDRALKLMGDAFPFFATAIGADDDGLRTVTLIGVDYEKAENVASAFSLLASAAGVLIPTAARSTAANSPAAQQLRDKPKAAPTKPAAKPTTTTRPTAAKKSSPTKKPTSSKKKKS